MKPNEERIKEIIEYYDLSDQCNTVPFVNEYGKKIFVELHAFNENGIYVDGELGESDLFVLANALKQIKEIEFNETKNTIT